MPKKSIVYLQIVLVVCAGLLLYIPDSGPALAQDSPLVLAFYYAWYDGSTWDSGLPADQPAQPYLSSDPATIERHVSQAQVAGIDALIQSWYGPQEAGNQTESNFRVLLDVAAARDFRAAVDFETTSPFLTDQASVAEALRYLLSAHAQHPAYLRYQDKPVIFFWRQGRFDVDEWAAIRAQVDPNHDSLWIAEGTDIAYQAVFDGHNLYSIAWSPDVGRTLTDWGFRVRRYEAQNGADRLWVATVMPGYDDTRTGRADAFAVDRRDGDYYRETWAAAIASQPDWIVVTSFNEWIEGTMIEPSLTYGDLYLDLTRELAMGFKAESGDQRARGQEPGASDQEPGAEDEGTGGDVPGEPYVRADEAVRVRAGPGTDYPRLGRLSPGETALVVGQNADSSWWQIEFPGADGGLGWVTAEFVTFVGDADLAPVRGDPTPRPTPTPTLTPSPTRRPSPTASPVSTPTFTPVPTKTSAPTHAFASNAQSSAQPPRGTATPAPTRSPTASPTPTSTPMLRVTPVSQRRPVGLLWVGGGALAIAFGLGVLVLRTIRSKG